MPSRRQIEAVTGFEMMAACRADQLSKVYGRRDTAVHALREITLSIPPRAFTAIMGPSGSGKSTLLHCLAALDTPTSGRVFLGQTELTSLSRRQQAQVRRDRIGFVFQAFNLVPTLDAIENITLPQLLAGRRPDKEWLQYVVARIGLGDRLHHRPSQLSGGQQQRVALARALAGRPEVIFADEPTGNLDTRASREMLALLRSAVDDFHQTVVTVTHDPAIAGYADQVLFFTDGQVVDQVLQPETSLVLERLQYLDSSTPAYASPRGQLHASTQSDGQHTMRSRRRRRANETNPGRPMVGSDDEVEVARQERWLQRIREQFEAEHDDGMGVGDTRAGAAPALPGGAVVPNGNGLHHATGNGIPPAPSAPPAPPLPNGQAAYGRWDAGDGMPAEPRNGHHHANGHDHGAGDDAWLPPLQGSLSGSPDETGASPNGTHDSWSHASVTASAPLPPARQAPPPPMPAPAQPAPSDDWHTADWEGAARTQRWEPPASGSAQQPAAWQPADAAQPDAWQPPAAGGDQIAATNDWQPAPAEPHATNDWQPAPAEPHATNDWQPTDAAQPDAWQPPAAGGDQIAATNDWQPAPAEPHAANVWSDPAAPPAHEEWAEIMPSQPPAPSWETPAAPPAAAPPQANGWDTPAAPPQANGWDTPAEPQHPAAEPHANGWNGAPPEPQERPAATQRRAWRQWRPDEHAEPAASGDVNGASAHDRGTGVNGYDDARDSHAELYNGTPQHGGANGTHHDQRDHAVHEPRPGGYEPAAGSHDDAHGGDALHPTGGTAAANGTGPTWTVGASYDAPQHSAWDQRGAPATDAATPQHSAWDQRGAPATDAAEEAVPLGIWSPPTAGDGWTPGADDDAWSSSAGSERAWTPTHTPPPAQPGPRDDGSQTGPFGHVDPPPPSADAGGWGTPPPDPAADDPYLPRPEPRGTTTDPFEALHSLQSQLNRLSGNSRTRPPRSYGE